MDISVTDFKARCLDVIRKVEKSRKAVTIRRRGKVVARLEPAQAGSEEQKPWEQLRAYGARRIGGGGRSVRGAALSVLLDTQVWLWWLTGQSSLPERERISLDLAAARQELCLSAISLWEAQMLHATRRVELPLPFAEWLRRAAAPGVVRVLALATHDERIRRASCGPREYQVAAEGCPPIT